MQLKREAKLLTVIGLNTKHADCHIIFMLYPIRLYSTANENHNEIDVRSNFTIQSYVRIDRFGIDYQSVIDQSNQFIHLPIIQSFKSFILLYRSIHSTKIRNRKSDEIHKSAQCLMRFIYSIYLFNKCHNFIFLIIRIGMSLVIKIFIPVVKQSQKNKM